METIKNIIPAEYRSRFYAVAGAIVAALTSFGVITEDLAPAIAGVATAAVTLIFAILHSTSPWRQAIYGLAGAIGVLMVATGAMTDGQTSALLAVVAAVFGIGMAGATAPAPDDTPGRHAAEV